MSMELGPMLRCAVCALLIMEALSFRPLTFTSVGRKMSSSTAITTPATTATATVTTPGTATTLFETGPRNDLSWHDRSLKRRANVQKMDKRQEEFATGQELLDLRSDLSSLRENLGWAEALQDQALVKDLTKAIRDGERRDPETTYTTALQKLEEAKEGKKLETDDDVERWSIEAASARSCLPRFNLEGLWVGNYGEPGLEMINVTYTGDKLVATKVTGDKNVPRGEVSFTADLTSRSEKQQLPPIKLGDHDAARWGVDELARYPGKGNIAKTGFVDVKAVDGQLLMFGPDHFSFVWVPTQHHVLFGRPSAEIAVRLLRDIISEEDETANMRAHAQRCLDLDRTTSLARQHAEDEIEPFRRIKREADLRELDKAIASKKKADKQKQNSNAKSAFSGYLDFRKWKDTLDDVLGK